MIRRKATREMRRLAQDERGAAAVEFALIAPVMLLLLSGIIELSNYLSTERRILEAASVTADLIGQSTDLTTSDLNDIYQAAIQVMAPYSTSSLKIGVASVRYNDTTGVPYSGWTSSYNSGAVSNATTQATGLGAAGESIIIVTVGYTFTPILKTVFTTTKTLSETTFVRPRSISYVGKY